MVLLLSLKHRALLEHMIHGLAVSTARSWILVWADLIDGLGSLVSKASSLLARLANLASLAMDDSIEWRPPFEEMKFEFLELSLVSSHWMVFSARFSYKSHPSFSSFCKNPPWHMLSKRVLVE